MAKKVNTEICGFCDNFDGRYSYCPYEGEVSEEDTCDRWVGDDGEKLEAQAVDAAERETHRKETEGEIE